MTDTPTLERYAGRVLTVKPENRIDKRLQQKLASAGLILILGVQAMLSVRLLDRNTAFTDEALYLWGGRLEWARLLHGAKIPELPTYFSGAPVLYPPIGAAASHFAGLVGARMVSLAFMLGATFLLWATATRLFGRVAGVFAALSWGWLGPTMMLGALATFDPMAIFLTALAVWCVIRAKDRLHFTGWILAGAAALATANAACYSSVIFDPAVVAITVLVDWPRPTCRAALMRVSAFGFYLVSALVLAILGAGGSYTVGAGRTVFSRSQGTDAAWLVLRQSWDWTAVVVVVATLAVIVGLVFEQRRPTRLLLVVLAVTALVVPIEQARLHTAESLDKHVDAGAWFAAIAVGYLASRVSHLPRRAVARTLMCGVLAIAACLPVYGAAAQATSLDNWANASRFVAVLTPLIKQDPGPILVETPSPARYYLEKELAWQRWSSTWTVTLANGRSEGSVSAVTGGGQANIYELLIAHSYFSLVALNRYATPALDTVIEGAMARSHAYAQVTSVPYGRGRYIIWQRIANSSAS